MWCLPFSCLQVRAKPMIEVLLHRQLREIPFRTKKFQELYCGQNPRQ